MRKMWNSTPDVITGPEVIEFTSEKCSKMFESLANMSADELFAGVIFFKPELAKWYKKEINKFGLEQAMRSKVEIWCN